jgi:K(+)-stimulated pyrophosphate-energized sodium pump
MRMWSGLSALALALVGAIATDVAAAVPTLAQSLPPAYFLAPAGAVLALVMAFVFYGQIIKHSEGDESMIRIAQAVREGAYAYLRRQYKIVAGVFVALVLVLLVMSFGMKLQPQLTALGVPIAGLLSGLCGYFGMKTATSASARTAHAAKQSLNDGLKVAFRAGAVMGLCVTGFALLDISVWFFLLTQVFGYEDLNVVTTITLSFAMGASLQALFARVGGGIYTKAADVGADLVGKVEAGIPEDDARNPATIADNVGDNVGDVAGMGADLYESYYGSILASMALAAAAAFRLNLDASEAIRLVSVAPALAGIGIMLAIVGIFTVRTKEGATMSQLLKSLHGGVWLSSAFIVVASGGILYWLLGDAGVAAKGITWWGIWVAIIAGLAAGLVIAWGTELYTSYEHKPTQRIAEQAQTGPATVIISGIAEGMISTWIPLLTVVFAILLAFTFAGGNETFLMGVFGVGIAAVGMLSTLAITLATDAYGPIADNAGGNAEMTHQPPFVRERTDMLDSLGNTTAATGKGFAIGSAALTALALLAAYVITVQAALTSQVREQSFAFEASAETATMAYLGNGLFKVSPLGRADFDAGLLLQSDKRRAIDEAVQVKQVLPAHYDASLGVFEVETRSADGAPIKFEVAPASTATLPQLLQYYNVTLMNPRVLCGLFIGVMLVMVFCAMTMNAVGRAAFAMMQECRRQFGIMKDAFRAKGMSEADIADPMKWPFEIEANGKRYPDYANCVAISTAGAQREMIVPSVMAVLVPIVVGLVLGVAGVMGMLAGALVCGFAVAIFMANAGGAWDNAKKYIEAGHYGGKRSDPHKAAVVGDTVGDPFKDTSGPSLNILIKLVSVVSVVFAGLIVKFSPMIGSLLHLG